jgi:hypothetical protein
LNIHRVALASDLWHHIFMQEKRERWRELCELAANEQDGEKLLELTAEIDRLLAEKQDRLARAKIPSKPSE